jgi:GNAT superfamily N-acetyltransferase
MEPKQIVVDEMVTVIKLMGHDYIMADNEPPGVMVEVNCREGGTWPNPLYVTYFNKLIEAYGTGAIFAWQKKTLVGFLPIWPVDCGLPRLPQCIHYSPSHPEARPNLNMIKQSTPISFGDLKSKILKVQCVAVKLALQRKGIGSAMVRYLVDWAKAQGWEKIQGWAFENGGFNWLPDIAFWEKCGFKRGISRVFDGSDPEGSEGNRPGFEFAINCRVN